MKQEKKSKKSIGEILAIHLKYRLEYSIGLIYLVHNNSKKFFVFFIIFVLLFLSFMLQMNSTMYSRMSYGKSPTSFSRKYFFAIMSCIVSSVLIFFKISHISSTSLIQDIKNKVLKRSLTFLVKCSEPSIL